jgi:hypothetical protein
MDAGALGNYRSGDSGPLGAVSRLGWAPCCLGVRPLVVEGEFARTGMSEVQLTCSPTHEVGETTPPGDRCCEIDRRIVDVKPVRGIRSADHHGHRGGSDAAPFASRALLPG